MLSQRVAKDHSAQHPPWGFLLQGESVEGGGLECAYGDGGQPENREHHQWVCESMVRITGGRELGKDVRCHFPRPWSIRTPFPSSTGCPTLVTVRRYSIALTG